MDCARQPIRNLHLKVLAAVGLVICGGSGVQAQPSFAPYAQWLTPHAEGLATPPSSDAAFNQVTPHVYVASGASLQAIGAASGFLNWSYPSSAPIGGAPAPVPLKNGGEGIFAASSDGYLLGFNVNGSPLWPAVDTKRKDGLGNTICAHDGILASPIVQLFNNSNPAFQAAVKDDLVMVGTSYSSSCAGGYSANRVYAVYASTGQIAWIFNFYGSQIDFIQAGCTLDYANNCIYVGCNQPAGRAQPTLLQISTLDGSLIAARNYGAIRNRPILRDDRLYVATYDGLLRAISTNGLVEIWNHPITDSANVTMTPVAALLCGDTQTKVFVTDSDGYLHGVVDQGTNASSLWPAINCGGVVSTAPVILPSQGKAYVGVSVNSQMQVWQIDLQFGLTEAHATIGSGGTVCGCGLDTSSPFAGLPVDHLNVSTSTGVARYAIPWPAGATGGGVDDGQALLAIKQSVSPLTGVAGQPVTYTLNVTNEGPYTATDVTVSDVLEGGVTNASFSISQGVIEAQTVTCSDFISYLADSGVLEVSVTNYTVFAEIGTLAVGASAQATITVIPTQIGSLTNTASVVADQFNIPNGALNTSTVTLSILDPAQLPYNGGFETGDFSYWSRNGNLALAYVTTNSSYVHSGNYGAQLGPTGTPGSLSQTLTTSMGQLYLVSFWLNNLYGAAPNEFSVSWNGTNLWDEVNIGETGWTNLQLSAMAAGTNTVLEFGFRNDPSFFGLDDVTVFPITVPRFQTLALSGYTISFVWSTQTGLNYQLQYTTNLDSAIWFNLGSPVPATGATLNATDTITNDPQRFYRLELVP